MKNWLVFGIVIFVQVISEQINYKVEATTTNGLLSHRSCDEGIPGPVQNLQNAVNETTVGITWDPPEDASCVNEYIISYDGNDIRVSDTTHEINNLLYCTTYQIQVAAVSGDDSIGEYLSTIVELHAPYPFGAVQNFDLALVERTLNATWEHPSQNAAPCVGKYVIQMWNQNNNVEDHETTETYYEFSPVVGCMTYNVQVKPWVNQSMEGSTSLKSYSVGDLATNPPTTATGATIDKTWANLMWATDSYTVNMCTLNAITVVCVSLDTADWIVSMQTVTYNISDSSTRPNIATNITELSEFTNYSCRAVINNSGGDSEESEPYLFQTGEEVPSEPLLLAEGEKTSTSFTFSWSEPYKIPGILQDYGIVIERVNAEHFIPDDCSIVGESYFAVNVETDVNEFVYESGLPNFKYRVNVNASTRVGNGDAAEIDVVTLNDTPERPRDITYSLDIAQSTDYLVNVSIRWLLPCNTNGELNHFEITITGTPTFEETEVTIITDTVNRNSDIEDVSYEYIIQHINASYSYNISIHAVLVDGIEGELNQLGFISPDGYPGEPILDPIENSESTSFYITWTEPGIKNGELLNYSITIQSHGPLYPVEDERCTVDTGIYTFWQPADLTSYNFTEAKPFYNYSVVIAAATSVGYGSSGNIEFVYTKAAKPDIPSVLNHQHEEHDLTDYNVTGIISWSVPCEPNGALSHFRIIIEGISTYDERNEKDEIEVDDTGKFSFIIERPLQAAFNYSILIATVLNDTSLQSDDAEINFLAPDGYPGQPLLHQTEDIGSTYVYFTWSEPITKNGKLQNYSISVQSHGPLYAVSEECDVDTTLYSYVSPADSNEFNFTEAKPYYSYSVSLSAATSIGYGAESEVHVVNTQESQPKPPTSLNSSYEEHDLTNYNVTGTVSWNVPCEVNGDLSYFKLIIEGNSTYNEGSEWEEVQVFNTEEFSHSSIYALQAAYNYKFSIINVLSNELESEESAIELLAPDGYPAAPSLNDPSNETPYSFDISWVQPNTTNGKLVTYSVTVTDQGPSYEVPENCPSEDTSPLVFNINANYTTHEFVEARPYHAYSINVKAATSRGFGVESEDKYVTTKRTASEPVENLSHTIVYGDTLEYDPKLTVSFERPCHTYGIFSGYNVHLLGVRNGKEPHNITEQTTVNIYTSTSIKPDYNYAVSVSVLTEDDYESQPINATFVSQAGVPLGVTSVDEFSPPQVDGPYTATYTFSSDLFDDSNGEILYYAIIIGVYGYHEESIASTWRGTSDSWPLISSTNETLVYQATPKMWNPFQESGNTTVTFYIGVGNCSTVYEDCNKELEPETDYAFKVRGFTSHGYRDSPTVTFVTDKLTSAKLAMILGIVFGVLAALVISGFIFVLWRRKRHWFEKKVSVIEAPSSPNAIPVKEFPQYYSNLMLNYNMLKAEYTLLESRTKEIDKVISVADLPEHKTKNRYCNIKPFDETRVILRSDNNGNYSDYINASYLKGYSGNTEYIATQGPLEVTCLDFWRMVLQENVTVIAMVAQCVEQSREKCYQYFPEKHETVEIGDGIEVRCTTELNFGTYIVKNLLVQRDLEKHTLTHLQFVEWPDFGCPTDTSNLLEFCQMMRNCHTREGGKIVVHCSAGVGRSGTLIAVDMLLQGIQANRDIDIFGTVLNLRQQRPKMVQTEKQYAYIHRCVNDVILNPLKTEEPKRPSEAIYENIGFFRENNSNTSSKEKLVKESIL